MDLPFSRGGLYNPAFMYTLRQSAVLCWGKVRRALLIRFRRAKVTRMLERRRGECLRCGACCKLLIRCPAYDESGGVPRCCLYDDRPGACGLFPLDESDLKDRDIVQPHVRCGYTFADVPGGNGQSHERAIRWGPPKFHPNGERRLLWGVWAVLWFCLRRSNGRGNGHP